MKQQDNRAVRILVVCGNRPELSRIQRWLHEAGFSSTKYTETTHEVLTCFVAFNPDIVIFDLQISKPIGHFTLTRLRELDAKSGHLAIIAITDPISEKAKKQAVSSGVSALLNRPLGKSDFLLQVNTVAELQRLRRMRLEEEQAFDSERKELEEAQAEIVERLALVTEYRDDKTLEHTRRVGDLSAETAKKLGMPDDFVELMRLAAPLHDMGKTAIADALLLKPGKLTPSEFAVMKAHTTIGANILSQAKSKLLKMAEEIALTHHERWGGGGYPNGLSGEDIPISGRIVAVADVFDALTHQRPYKEEWSVYRAVNEISLLTGEQFDPDVVDAFFQVLVEQGIVEAHKLAA